MEGSIKAREAFGDAGRRGLPMAKPSKRSTGKGSPQDALTRLRYIQFVGGFLPRRVGDPGPVVVSSSARGVLGRGNSHGAPADSPFMHLEGYYTSLC